MCNKRPGAVNGFLHQQAVQRIVGVGGPDPAGKCGGFPVPVFIIGIDCRGPVFCHHPRDAVQGVVGIGGTVQYPVPGFYRDGFFPSPLVIAVTDLLSVFVGFFGQFPVLVVGVADGASPAAALRQPSTGIIGTGLYGSPGLFFYHPVLAVVFYGCSDTVVVGAPS